MKDTDPDRDNQAPAKPSRPDWVDEQDQAPAAPPRRERSRQPVPGDEASDGLWEHALVTGGLAAALTFVAAVLIPRAVPVWMINTTAATLATVAGTIALNLTRSIPVAAYLFTWGYVLTGWITAARIVGAWHGPVIFALLIPVLILIPSGVAVIRRHWDRVRRLSEAGRDTANVREIQHWDDLLHRYGVQGVTVKDVLHVDGGYQVWCRHRKIGADGGRPVSDETIRDLALPLTRHKRLARGSVYIEEEPAGGTAADFIIHVRSVTGPRLTRFLPAENSLLSITREFALGVFDNGREFKLKLREIVLFICGIRGSGKSTLLNVLIAQLARMPDALIFMIDLKEGQESMAWLLPWLRGLVDEPVIHWLATTRQEADIMLDALKRAGQARAGSGAFGKKLRPDKKRPAILVLCDETTVMTGHFQKEDGLSSTKLATKLLQIAETFRSVAIDPVVSTVRAVVDNTGNSGLKAMSEGKIGMRVNTVEEGRQIFPDNLPAARQLAQLRDRGMGIPKIGPELFPPVHFYNITDGYPDDDGNPTEDRITPIAVACASRRPQPEPEIIAAMGEAYANRWKQPHLMELMAGWTQGASAPVPAPVPAGPPPSDPPPASSDLPDDFEKWRAELGLDAAELTDDEPGRPLNPVRKRMRHLLIERPHGWKPDALWHQLMSEGHTVRRETVQRWLAADEKLGYVYRTGKPRNLWVWRLPPGAEFDIPGMS